MPELLYPERPGIDDLIPRPIRHSNFDPRFVADWAEDPLSLIGRKGRQRVGVLYFGHRGFLLDEERRVQFDLTPLEFARWLEELAGRTVTDEEVRRSICVWPPRPDTNPAPERTLIRCTRRRTCRVAESPQHAFRLKRGLFPIEMIDLYASTDEDQ